MLKPTQDATLLFRALGDDSRLKIFQALMNHRFDSVEAIVRHVHLPRPTVCYALQRLHHAGLVDYHERKTGPHAASHEYYILPDRVKIVVDALAGAAITA